MERDSLQSFVWAVTEAAGAKSAVSLERVNSGNMQCQFSGEPRKLRLWKASTLEAAIVGTGKVCVRRQSEKKIGSTA